MEKPMRRQDRKITDSEAIDILNKEEYGILSMCTTNNEGYGIPLNFAVADRTIYFHCAVEGSKLDYLRNNNKASFCVVGETMVLPSKFGTIYESAIASGTVSEIEGEEKQVALMLLIEKYSSDFIPEGKDYISKLNERVKVLKLSIESITGKARKV
jgi:uncharacterized protein